MESKLYYFVFSYFASESLLHVNSPFSCNQLHRLMESCRNLILLDESPLFSSSHLFGFFSVFNADAIKDTKLYKGGIPAKYGGRLSSVLDIRQKEGNNKHFSASGGLGLLFSRLTIEGPILKDKVSFIVSGRRSYFDIFFPLANKI